MKANVGGADRTFRVLLGLGLLSLFFVLDGNARFLALIGAVPLLTAAVSYCPLYSLLGLNTCSVKR